jgi:hypothetical protein
MPAREAVEQAEALLMANKTEQPKGTQSADRFS